jgi:hypothetical protein
MEYRQLNHNQLRVVAEYLAVMPRNATAAYRRVHPNANYDTARNEASRMLADPRIQDEIAKREAQMQANLAMTAEDVIREIALVATADQRELTEHYRGACRHCHGIEFRYQRRPSEYQRDFEKYLKTSEGRADPFGVNFPLEGGVGFSTRKEPNPECPECDGNGVSYEIFKDTRNLSPGAARLFDGVERTKDGLKIKSRDRGKYLDMAAQHLGIVKKSVELTGKNGGPIQNASVSLVDMDPQTASTVYQNLVGGA